MVHRTSHSAAGSCDYTCGGERYDMRGLLRLGGAAITAADKSGAVYHVGVCGQELPPSLQCNSSTAAGRVSSGSNSAADLVAATRVSGGGCSTIGTWEDRSGLPMPCYQRDPSNPSSGIKCHLYAGDETTGSSVVVEYVCRPEGALPPIIGQIGSHTYHATMSGPEACAVGGGWLLPVSIAAGSSILLVVACFLFVRLRRCRAAAKRGTRAAGGSGGGSGDSSSAVSPPANVPGVSGSADLRRQLLEDSDDDEERALASPVAATSNSSPAAYVPFAPPAVADPAPVATAADRVAAVDGLEMLMQAADLEDRLAAAGAWCEEHGWTSVAHLRTAGGARAADALIAALRLKPGGARAKRLNRELQRDVWGWDAHAAAARATSAHARERG